MASDTKNVKLGVCSVSYDGVDLGLTQGGVEVMVSTETHVVEVDQFGKTPINEYLMGRTCKVKVPMAETTLDNLVAVMPGSTLVTDGAKASGSITIAVQPTNGQTILVNGKTVTFKTAPAGALDVKIGANVAETAANLALVLTSSSDTALSNAEYVADGADVDVEYGLRGTVGNAFTLATGTAGASVTVSGATLTGGLNVTKARVDVTTGVGTNLLDIAKPLVLHPIGKPDYDTSDDFTVFKAATAGALQFSYKLEEERLYPVEFTGYPDVANNNKLFSVGDPDA
jgi:hypothetical protein